MIQSAKDPGTREMVERTLDEAREPLLLTLFSKVLFQGRGSSLQPAGSLVAPCLTGLVERGSEWALAKGGSSDVWKGCLRDPASGNIELVAIKVLRAVDGRSGYCSLELMNLVS